MLSGANYEPVLVFLLMWAAKAAVVLVFAFAATFALRRYSAALRHQIWAVAIIASLFLPIAAIGLPSWHIWTRSAPAYVQPASSAPLLMTTEIVAAPVPYQFHLADFYGAFVAVWALGSAIVLLRLAIGLVRLARTSAYAKAAPTEWTSLLDALCISLGVRRRIRLLESLSETTMPMTWGIFRPRIILPFGASEWAEDRRRVVLSHELAHIARGDWLFQIVAEILRACFWFSPLVWIAASRLRQESERACDDAVLNSGIAPSEYANELLALTQSLQTPSRRLSLALAIARPSNLERRFAAMLNPSTNRNPLQRTASLFAILLGAILLLPLATMQLWAEAPRTTNPAATQAIVAPTTVATPSVASATISPDAPSQVALAKLAAARAGAQSQQTARNNAGSITGVVVDPSAARVPKAVVDLTFEANPVVPSGEVVTGEVGEFTFPSLVPGNYTLVIRQPGFQAYTAQHIALAAGQQLDLHQMALRVGTISQAVSIHSSPSAVTAAPVPVDCGAPPPEVPAATPKPATPQDPNAPKAPTRIRIGGMVEQASLICRTAPVYPASARAAGIEGTVVLRAIIGKNGVVESLEWTNPDKVDSSLMKSAMDSVKDWRYKPVLLNGEPVEVETEITVVFSLSN
jgi:TonB family protein